MRLTSTLGVVLAFACAPATKQGADWPPKAKQWFERAQGSFSTLDIEDADEAIEQALKLQPKRPEVRELAGRIALAQLDYEGALKTTSGVATSAARATRARAFWYSGDSGAAADELEALLADPSVRDPWAEGVIKLARQGRGRVPYTVKGALLAVVEMPRVNGTAMVVPVELNGQPALGLLSTTHTEVYVDSSGGREPSWVSLRFQERIEVKDVPALTQDLSGLSRELGVPVKLLIGTHALRHLNATVDYLGRQFVVRTFEPPPPPAAARVGVHYVKAGGMTVRGSLESQSGDVPLALLLDSSSAVPLALDEQAWERSGMASARQPIAGQPKLSTAVLPSLRLGSFSVQDVPALAGVPTQEFEKSLAIALDGVLGSGFLSAFRITLTNQGRTLWMEDSLSIAESAEAPPSTDVEPALEAPREVPPQAPLEAPAPGAEG